MIYKPDRHAVWPIAAFLPPPADLPAANPPAARSFKHIPWPFVWTLLAMMIVHLGLQIGKIFAADAAAKRALVAVEIIVMIVADIAVVTWSR